MSKPLLIITVAAFLAAAIVASHAAEAAKPAPTPAAAPAVLPVVLTADDLKSLQDYLIAQPFSFASPLISFLAGKEAAAQAEAAKAKK